MSNPVNFTWADPTTNVDGSAIVAGEILGYTIGVRSTTAAGSVAGTYSKTVVIATPTATSEAVSALGLVPDNYAAAIRTNSAINSSWSAEIAFTIVPPTPNAPTLFSVA